MKKSVFLILIALAEALLFPWQSKGQAGFSFTDEDSTVCIEQTVEINNTTTGASSWDWNFCYASLTQTPQVEDLGLGNLGGPSFMEVKADYNGIYLFTVNHTNNTLTRAFLGDSPANDPTNETVVLSNLPGDAEGIAIVRDSVQEFHGFITSGQDNSDMLHVGFGADLNNDAPATQSLGIDSVLNFPQDVEFVQVNNTWYAFVANSSGNTLLRLRFGNGLGQSPDSVDVLTHASLSQPGGLEIVEAGGSYYLFVSNYSGPSISRFDLGSNIEHPSPSVTTLPQGNLQSPYDLVIEKDCQHFRGFVLNRDEDNIVRLDFTQGIAAAPQQTDWGSLDGSIYHGHGFSEMFMFQGSRYLFSTNFDGDAVLRFSWESCENAIEVATGSALVTSSAQNPPDYYYDSPGTYYVSLVADNNLQTESQACHQIQVVGGSFNLGADTILCPKESLKLQIPSGYTNPAWQDNSTGRQYTVTTPGKYYVDVTSPEGCDESDTINVDYSQDLLNLGNDTTIKPNGSILLDAGPGFQSYLWSTGSEERSVRVYNPGMFEVKVVDINGCELLDTINVDMLQYDVPSAFTPNGDGINDTWKLESLVLYPEATVRIYDRYGTLLYEYVAAQMDWDGTVDGELLPRDTYWYVIDYKTALKPKKGHVTIKY